MRTSSARNVIRVSSVAPSPCASVAPKVNAIVNRARESFFIGAFVKRSVWVVYSCFSQVAHDEDVTRRRGGRGGRASRSPRLRVKPYPLCRRTRLTAKAAQAISGTLDSDFRRA